MILLNAEEVYITIHNPDEKDKLWALLKDISFERAMDVHIKPATKDRSLNQNRLMWRWFKDAEDHQNGQMKAWEYRAHCKLYFGVPILRRDSESYKEIYDRLIKQRFTIEEKLSLMVEPMEFPVTSAMNVKQKTEFLDAMREWLEGEGIVLTNTEEMFS